MITKLKKHKICCFVRDSGVGGGGDGDGDRDMLRLIFGR